jgi:hypothetical protein
LGEEVENVFGDVGGDFFGGLSGIDDAAVGEALNELAIFMALAAGFGKGNFLLALVEKFGRGVEQEDEVRLFEEVVSELDDGLGHAQAVAALIDKKVVVEAVDEDEAAFKGDGPNAQVRAKKESEPVKTEV